MKYFKLSIISRGKNSEVILKGASKKEVIENFAQKNSGIIIKIEETSMPLEDRFQELVKVIQANFTGKKLNLPAFISSARQLAALTKAQISIKDSLANIGENATDPLVKELFLKAADGVDNGLNLSNTFEEYEHILGNLAIALIKLGEQTGALGEALDTLADVYEDIENNKQKFKKAMRMPMITMIAMAGAFTVLIGFVVPKFKSVFASMKVELPLPTKILLSIEHVINTYGGQVFMGIVALIILHKYMYSTNEKYKYQTDKTMLKIKIIGPLIRYSSVSRFVLVLSELTKAGIPLIDSLTIANGILENAILKEKIEGIIREINQGNSLTAALTKYDLLDNVTLQMISAGEEAGNIDTMLDNASVYYKNQFQQIIDTLGDAIEPIMMAVIGGLVLLLALGIFMPMWNMASSVK